MVRVAARDERELDRRAGNDGRPVSRTRLAEEAHGWIPDASIPLRHPPPVRVVMEQRPHGNAERAGEMRGHAVHSDDEIERAHEARLLPCVALLRERSESLAPVRALRPLLEHLQRDSWDFGEWCEELERNGAARIPLAGGPYDAHRELLRLARERRNAQIRNVVWNGLARRAEDVRELHDLGVHIVVNVRHAVVQWHEPADPLHRREQPQERRLRPHRQLLRDARDERCIPNELDRVAEPVVAAHEHTSSLERLTAPDGLRMARQMPGGRSASRFENAIAHLPRGREVAAPHVREPRLGRRLELRLRVHAHCAPCRALSPVADASSAAPRSVRGHVSGCGSGSQR